MTFADVSGGGSLIKIVSEISQIALLLKSDEVTYIGCYNPQGFESPCDFYSKIACGLKSQRIREVMGSRPAVINFA